MLQKIYDMMNVPNDVIPFIEHILHKKEQRV